MTNYTPKSGTASMKNTSESSSKKSRHKGKAKKIALGVSGAVVQGVSYCANCYSRIRKKRKNKY